MPQLSCTDPQFKMCSLLPSQLQLTLETAELNPSFSPEYILVDGLEASASERRFSFLFCYWAQGKHRVNNSSPKRNGKWSWIKPLRSHVPKASWRFSPVCVTIA